MKADELATVMCPKCGELMIIPKEEKDDAECWLCGTLCEVADDDKGGRFECEYCGWKGETDYEISPDYVYFDCPRCHETNEIEYSSKWEEE